MEEYIKEAPEAGAAVKRLVRESEIQLIGDCALYMFLCIVYEWFASLSKLIKR